MAYDPELDKNINELPVATTLTGSELVEVIQDGVNKQTTAQYIANLFGGGGGGGITWAGTLGYIPMASAESGGNITTMVDSPQSYLNNLFSTTFTAQPSKPADWFLWLKGGATSTDYAVIDCYITDTGTGSGSVAIQTSNATASYINECFAGRTTARILSSKNTGESASFYTQDTGAAAVSATLSFAISVVGFAGGKVLTNDGSLNIVESVTTATELSYVSGATSPLQAQIDALVSGLSWKQAVRVATTTNGTLSTAYANGQTVDGVVLATGDRILLKNQSTATQNGIYVVNASGAPTRSTDMNQGSEFPSATTSVSEGTTNADTQWVCTNDSVTVGSTNVVFVSVGGTSYVGTTNRVTVTGNVIDIAATYVGQTSITTLGTITTGTWNGSAISTTYTDAKIKTVTGTTNRISIGGTSTDPTFDISTAYVGQATITTLGTVATGVWNGTIITGQYGGTGVANTGFTITVAGNLATTGAFNTTLAAQASVTTTLPAVATTLAGKTGTMAASYIGYWNDANQLTGSANFTYDGTSVVHTGSVAGALFSITNSTSSAAAKGLLITMSANGHNAAQGILVLKSTTSGGGNTLTMLDLQQNGQNATTAQEILITYNLRDNSIGRTAGTIAFKYSDVGSGTQKTGWTFRNLVGGTTLTDSAQILGQDFKLLVAGGGIYVKEGSNATMGVATLVAGTVTVNTTKVTANSRIILTTQSLGTVAVPTEIAVTARTAATSFTITSASVTDTSVVAWIIIEPS